MKEDTPEINQIEDEVEMEGEETIVNKSAIADPIFEGKLLERCLKLVKKIQEHEKDEKKDKGGKKVRYIRRGVHEVTKSIRKGQKGLVLIACDIHPVDIIAHIPILCEEKNVYYGYLGSKKTLGTICKSKRPASVLMISFNDESLIKDKPFYSIYSKVISSIKKVHPYI
ncbi:HMG-like nuclear protein and pelota RNA binding domain-containing protein [Cryptosporidium canis]|uniref:HMG-like nuclear protein and pelota RNA binding domain-containing protein n=1 Tax=Cryptosporidium canis TaxID=195482 RepID=A0A9D5DIW5_9CRYT|nr:HMG-like nuclear protein and pelota RNA binding domain-containing protein [Cryptosporidium canis]